MYMFFINNLSSKIEDYCEQLNINYDAIIKYLTGYIDLKNKLYILENNLYPNSKIDFINFINESKKILIDENIFTEYDKLTTCLLLTYPINSLKKIENTNFYLSVNNPAINSVFQIKKLGRSSKDDTLVDNIYKQNFIWYYFFNMEDSSISMIHYVDERLIQNSNIQRSNKIFKYENTNTMILENYATTRNKILLVYIVN